MIDLPRALAPASALLLSLAMATAATAQVSISTPSLTPEQKEAQKAAAAERRAQFERDLAERFAVSGNEVYDRKTDRTWQRCNFGQTYDAEHRWCAGIIKRVDIDAATSDVSANAGGRWRIPDAGEMMSVLDVACTSGMKDVVATVFPEVLQGPTTYYLTTTSSDSSHVTAAHCFIGAQTSGVGRKMVSVVWLVRNGH